MRDYDSPGVIARLSAPASALAVWVRAAVLRRQPVAAVADGLVYNNRNDGPPDLDELWRDFNRI